MMKQMKYLLQLSYAVSMDVVNLLAVLMYKVPTVDLGSPSVQLNTVNIFPKSSRNGNVSLRLFPCRYILPG